MAHLCIHLLINRSWLYLFVQRVMVRRFDASLDRLHNAVFVHTLGVVPRYRSLPVLLSVSLCVYASVSLRVFLSTCITSLFISLVSLDCLSSRFVFIFQPLALSAYPLPLLQGETTFFGTETRTCQRVTRGVRKT